MEHRPLTPSGFGWELPALDPDTVLDAFHASGGMILIRGQQELTPSKLREFAAIFGRLEKNEKYDPDFLLPGVPEILRIGNLKEGARYRSLFLKADPPPLLWHCDDSFRNPQPLGSCMLCIATPPRGGETGFAGTTAAYDALSDEMKERIEDLTAVHSYNHLNEYLRKRNAHRPPLSPELRAQHPPVTRPLAPAHPVTGRKSLYVPKCHMESVSGLSADEAESLLSELLDHATGEDFKFMHRWAPGDVVVWDNRCVLHAPSPFDDTSYPRLMYRLTMSADR